MNFCIKVLNTCCNMTCNKQKVYCKSTANDANSRRWLLSLTPTLHAQVKGYTWSPKCERFKCACDALQLIAGATRHSWLEIKPGKCRLRWKLKTIACIAGRIIMPGVPTWQRKPPHEVSRRAVRDFHKLQNFTCPQFPCSSTVKKCIDPHSRPQSHSA